ncbi:MAG: phosphatase PAP2 family protein, partial [Alicyclobacillaceae bacterium]|nr:phosphatase PAP2 family protein [Alicyclobacillaceae bacterium]
MPEENFTFPPGYQWQYHVLLWFQKPASPWLDRVAMWASHLGLEWFYLVAVPVVLWSVNRTVGLRLAYIFLCSMFVNAWLKDVYQVARPIGVPGIRTSFLASASGHSFPSGHAQGSMTFWGVIASWLRRPWVWWGAMALVAVVGAARLY